LPKDKPVEIWFQDEVRIGQKNGIVRQLARRGTRPGQRACQSARKVDPGSASKRDPFMERDGERPTGWSWSGLRSPVGRFGEAF
jgi:hypothetical protein